MCRLATIAALAILSLVAGSPARAAVVVGVRVFPVTLNFDDPGVGDELRLPQLVWQRRPVRRTSLSFSGNGTKRSRP